MGNAWRAVVLLVGLAALAGSASSMRPTGCPEGYFPDPHRPGYCLNQQQPGPAFVDGNASRGVVNELLGRCSQGEYDSCTELGGIYLRGAIVPRDPFRAERYLVRACEHDHADGCDILATAYTSDVELENERKAKATRARACQLRGKCQASATPEDAPGADGQPAPGDEDTYVGSGTCFAVSDDGLIATAAHVIEGAELIVVRFGDEEGLRATTVVKSTAVDLALLRVERRTSDYVRVVADPSIELGDDVFTVGFPRPDAMGWEPKFTDGNISSLAVGGESALMQISVPIHRGNSGGPLVSEQGVLYGVVVAKLKALEGETTNNVGFAVKAPMLAAVMDPADVHKRGKPLTRKEAIRSTTAATCLVKVRGPKPHS